ncbi:hypothetical protein CCACVL1_06293 [Corchorus capsularis]|uniref:Uncharacterized protein n=1 Tax=Corchorus capsularis TaxID=210143 RepID=A0A1R3JGE7_COCAP|nr:hypothetical protein CCACVL1_06293 [Corchorus capsularis]
MADVACPTGSTIKEELASNNGG